MSSKLILLINPYTRDKDVNSKMINSNYEEPYPSVGLLYLASSLRKNNYNVIYLDIPAIVKQELSDCNKSVRLIESEDGIDGFVERTIVETFNHYSPDFVGINCLFSGKFTGVVFICSILKKLNEALPIAIGGIHPTIFHKEILERFVCVDFVIIGEGEQSFTQLVNCFFYKNSFSDVMGLCYRSGKKVIVNPKEDFISNLDNIPIPAWDLLDLKHYEIEQDKWEKFWHNPLNLKLQYRWPILTSRSCPVKCNFCAMSLVHGKKIRYRSAENCYQEIYYLYKNYGINYFSIIDDNFTVNKRRVIELSKLILKRNLKIYIDTPNGISMNYFNEEVLRAMKDMGLLRIYFAIESGSDYIRNEVMGKNMKKEKISYVSELMRNEKDIYIRAFFIIGMPQETKETLEETYNMIKTLYIDSASIHFAIPFPGTRLYDEVISKDLLTISKGDALIASNYQLSSDVPFIKPYNLEIDELIAFKKRVEELFDKRYENLGIDKKEPIHHLL